MVFDNGKFILKESVSSVPSLCNSSKLFFLFSTYILPMAKYTKLTK